MTQDFEIYKLLLRNDLQHVQVPGILSPKLRHGHKNGVLLNTKKVGFIVFLKLWTDLSFLTADFLSEVYSLHKSCYIRLQAVRLSVLKVTF